MLDGLLGGHTSLGYLLQEIEGGGRVQLFREEVVDIDPGGLLSTEWLLHVQSDSEMKQTYSPESKSKSLECWLSGAITRRN